MTWREWLERVSSRYECALTNDLGEENACAKRLLEEDVPKLINSFTLMADALESIGAVLHDHGKATDKMDALTKYMDALDHLRGVGDA